MFFPKKGQAPNARRAGFERLEAREMLDAAQGVPQATLDAVIAEYPGFDYSGIVASQVYVVDATAGTTVAKLKEAITAAQKRSGADLILVTTSERTSPTVFSKAGDSIVVDDADPVMIVSRGAERFELDGAGKARLVNVTGRSNLSLGGVALSNGKGADGGAIRAAGRLTLDRVRLYDSVATGRGGALYCESTLEMTNTIVSGNRSTGNGGGVYVSNVGNETILSRIVNSTITGNIAGYDGEGFGGGVYFTGMDADFNITAELKVDNSIIVQNLSSATECDVNIYNAAFRNETEVMGEKYVFEIPVAALIDGSNNLSSFIYWVSTYDAQNESATGSNRRYHEATPLFVANYDFEARVQGDYNLVDSGLSQALDAGSNAAAVYANGQKIARDYAGERRVQNLVVDLGACERAGSQADLSTGVVGSASLSQLVVGGALTISGLEATNRSDLMSNAFVFRLYASTDATIDDTDVEIGEIVSSGLAPGETRAYSTSKLATSLLDPGKNYYVGWKIVCDADPDDSNNVGRLGSTVYFYAENDDAIATTPFEKTAYSTQEGCEFYLAPASSTTAAFGSGYEYWLDLGQGAYVKRDATGWFSTIKEGLTRGSYDVELKIVDPSTRQVVGKGAAALTVGATEPRLEVVASPLGTTGLRLAIAARTGSGAPVPRWRVNWGDGQSSSYDALGYDLTVAHLYAPQSAAKTYNITITLYSSESDEIGVTYRVGAYRSTPTSNALLDTALIDAAFDDAFDSPLEDAFASLACALTDEAHDASPSLAFLPSPDAHSVQTKDWRKKKSLAFEE